MPNPAEIIAATASNRRRLKSIRAKVVIRQVRAGVEAEWSRYVSRLPAGSISRLAVEHESGDEAEPSNVWPLGYRQEYIIRYSTPGRWRLDSRVGDEREAVSFVLDVGRWWFDVVADGRARKGSVTDELAGIPAAIMRMIEPEETLREIDWTSAASEILDGRHTYRLVGTCTENTFVVWPAEHYEAVIDRRYGVLLRFVACADGGRIAEAVFSDVVFNATRASDFEPPRGTSWHPI